MSDPLRKLALQDGRYAPEAFQFLYESLDSAVRLAGREQSEGKERHVSGQELLAGLRAHALELFGPLAAPVWRAWGVRETLDWGRIVFLLVDAGLLNRQESDTIEDFRGVYDLERALGGAYVPRLPADVLGHAEPEADVIDRLSPTVRNVLLAALCVLAVWFLWSVRAVLNPLLLGYLLAFVLHPLVLRLEKRGWRRRKAVNTIFFGAAVGFTLLSFMVWTQGRSLVNELASDQGLGLKARQRIEAFVAEHREGIEWVMKHVAPTEPEPAPAGSEGANGAATTTAAPAQAEESGLSVQELVAWLRAQWDEMLTVEQQEQATELGLRAAGGAVSLVQKMFGSLLALFWLVLLLPIYTYFLLFELERIHAFVARYLPKNDRARLVGIGRQIGEVLANFFRGRLLVCLAKGAFLALGLRIVGIDYALLIGLSTGFLTLVPFVGSAVGFALALLVGLIDHDVVPALVRVGIVFGAAEALENYVLLPKILGDSLGLHPVVVIFSLMAGAASLGMFGLILALPLTATIVILVRELLLPVLRQMADTPPATAPATPSDARKR